MYSNNAKHRRKFWKHHDKETYECDNCSVANGTIHVHHKDGNVGNGALSNLAGLCEFCHKVEHEGKDENQEPEVEGWKRGFEEEMLSESDR